MNQASIISRRELDEEDRRALMRRILEAINAEPLTARMVASSLGINEHQAGRRLSDLLVEGYAERGEKVRNPTTGKPAYLHTASKEGRYFLRTGERPTPAVKRGDLVKAVILAARNVVDAELHLALKALDAHDAGQPQAILRAPYGDPRRSALVREGKWLRSNGSVVALRDLSWHHLNGAIQWLRRHGARGADASLQALLGEEARRLAVQNVVSFSARSPEAVGARCEQEVDSARGVA